MLELHHPVLVDERYSALYVVLRQVFPGTAGEFEFPRLDMAGNPDPLTYTQQAQVCAGMCTVHRLCSILQHVLNKIPRTQKQCSAWQIS